MMKPFLLAIGLFLCLTEAAYSQQNPAYLIFTGKGKKVSYHKMVKKLKDSDIVFFGELHNNPIDHWLQLEVSQDLKENSLILGAEMFERDNAEALSQYVAGEITSEAFDTLARFWQNYKTDYKPLVEFAKANQLPFIATNIPRRYASLVYRAGLEGLDTLPQAEKAWIAPLPIAYDAELPGYKNMLKMMEGHGGENLPKAQAIKDATMAHFILANYKPGSLFLHFNGAYHSDNYEGIVWYLKQQRPELRYTTITTVEQENVNTLAEEHKGKADFIICVPANMTKTY